MHGEYIKGIRDKTLSNVLIVLGYAVLSVDRRRAWTKVSYITVTALEVLKTGHRLYCTRVLHTISLPAHMLSSLISFISYILTFSPSLHLALLLDYR